MLLTAACPGPQFLVASGQDQMTTYRDGIA